VKDSRFCPACGDELRHREAEICPGCGVRLRDTPEPGWLVYVKAGIAVGILTVIIAAYLFGFWQGSMSSARTGAVVPVPTPTLQTGSPGNTTPEIPDTNATPSKKITRLVFNDYISYPSGGLNVSRNAGSLEPGGEAMYSMVLGRPAHTVTAILESANDTDFDLFISRNQIPTISDNEYRSNHPGLLERIEIWGAEPGIYYVLVAAASGSGNYTLTLTVNTEKASQSYPVQSSPFQSYPVQSSPFQSYPVQSNPFLVRTTYPDLLEAVA
jgi:hypothetical protein